MSDTSTMNSRSSTLGLAAITWNQIIQQCSDFLQYIFTDKTKQISSISPNSVMWCFKVLGMHSSKWEWLTWMAGGFNRLMSKPLSSSWNKKTTNETQKGSLKSYLVINKYCKGSNVSFGYHTVIIVTINA